MCHEIRGCGIWACSTWVRCTLEGLNSCLWGAHWGDSQSLHQSLHWVMCHANLRKLAWSEKDTFHLDTKKKKPLFPLKTSIRKAGCQRGCAVPILGSLKIHQNKALNDLDWSLTQLCFVQGLGKITSWDSFQLEFSNYLLTKKIFLDWSRPAAKHLHSCWSRSA